MVASAGLAWNQQSIVLQVSGIDLDRLFDELDAPVLRLSSQDIPTPYNGALENLTIVQPQQIVEAVQKMVALKV